MKYRRRLVEKALKSCFRHFPVVAVLGARQVGKSTLVANLFGEQIRTVVFDPVEDVGQARHDPDLFLQNNPPPLFLDEVQYAPELLSALKRWVDRRQAPGQYILSGSQNLAVVKKVGESLAGRMAIFELWPMSYGELTGNKSPKSFLESWI